MSDDNVYSSPPWKRQASLSGKEMEVLRQRAWHEQRILIVSPFDKRLELRDQTRLCDIGVRLYGSDDIEENE